MLTPLHGIQQHATFVQNIFLPPERLKFKKKKNTLHACYLKHFALPKFSDVEKEGFHRPITKDAWTRTSA